MSPTVRAGVAMRVFARQIISPAFAVSVMAALVGAWNSESSTEPEIMSAPQQTTGAMQASRRGSIDLGQCDSLAVSGRSQLLAHYYAVGDQIYFWDGTGWLFIGPDATLYAGKAMGVKVGVHQVAGVWESRDGSKVVGQVQRSCTPASSDISWQRLTALGQWPWHLRQGRSDPADSHPGWHRAHRAGHSVWGTEAGTLPG